MIVGELENLNIGEFGNRRTEVFEEWENRKIGVSKNEPHGLFETWRIGEYDNERIVE